MLRILEKETGIKLSFKREILTNHVSLNTILFELADEKDTRYLLALAYDCQAKEVFENIQNRAVWIGEFFHKPAVLLPYDENIFIELGRLLSAGSKDDKIAVDLYSGEEQPDFSMCRFSELYPSGECFSLKITEGDTQIILPVHIEGNTAVLGTWMSLISRAGLLKAIDYIFQHYKKIKKIEYKNVPFSVLLDQGWRHNDFFMVLPKSVEELQSGMTQKSRYNLRREKRIIEEKFGGLMLKNILADQVTRDNIELFYRFKNETHAVTQSDYDITKLPITDYYFLVTGDGVIRAIALSCEQGSDVFIENHTFDSSMREYSFGKHLYEMYIEALIEKGKTGLALAGGTLDYKNRYGTICAIVWSGDISRGAYRVWRALRLIGRGNKPLAIRRWTGKTAYIKSLIHRKQSKKTER